MVYQTVSNFGQPCRPKLVDHLRRLQSRGLINELVLYNEAQRELTDIEVLYCLSRDFDYASLGADDAKGVSKGEASRSLARQYVHELRKREIGRQRLAEAGCSHFMCLDADEYYLFEQLEWVKREVEQKGYLATACR